MRATQGNPPQPPPLAKKLTTLAEARSDESVTCRTGTKGTLITVVKVLGPSYYDCCKIVEAIFYFRAEGKRNKVDIGFLECNLIDKSVVDDGKDGQLVWLKETVNDADSVGNSDLPEIVSVMRHLYDTKGDVLAHLQEQHSDLLQDSAKILHLDSFKIYEKHRSDGLGPLSLAAFHSLLPKLNNGFAYSGTVVLSPCTPDGETDYGAAKGRTFFQQEQKLASIYGKAGYTVITQGSDQEDGSITVMGRKV